MWFLCCLVISSSLLLLAPPAAAEPVTIHCPTEPPVVRQLDLQERWRIDSDDPDAPLLGVFGESQVLAHAGRVYLLDQQLSHVLVYSDDGERVAEFHSEEWRQRHGQTVRIDEAAEHSPWMTAIAAGAGEVVLASARDEYRLEWRNLAGETLRVVIREYPAHRRTPDELSELRYSSYTIVDGDLRFPDRKLSDHDPVIRSLALLPDGGLRVRTSLYEKDLPPGMVCRFEVHEPTGELRERVEIYDPAGAYDVSYDAIALLDDGRALVLRNQRPAARVATDSHLHPALRDKLPPPPSARDDIAFTPIMCDLVPRGGPAGAREDHQR
jgi:hypothetical protein